MSSFLHAYARTRIFNQTKWHRQAFRKTLTYIYVYFDDICLSDRVTAPRPRKRTAVLRKSTLKNHLSKPRMEIEECSALWMAVDVFLGAGPSGKVDANKTKETQQSALSSI